jgi:uncharacterized protein (TIGR03435 family)
MRAFGAVLLAFGALAQTAPGPAFEVASVKPSGPNQRLVNGLFTYPGGRITAGGCKLEYLIMEAFDIEPFQISGGPPWVRQDRYDIEAKPPASSTSSQATPSSPKMPPNPEQRQMLQSLLRERFHLKYRREAKEGSVYFLIKTGKKLKLEEPKQKDAYPWVGSVAGAAINGDGLAGINASMPLLAMRLSRYLERPVIDRTELEGSFDFKFEYHTDDARPDLISSILTSVEGLGLKLETGRGPIETLVIESAERPAAN